MMKKTSTAQVTKNKKYRLVLSQDKRHQMRAAADFAKQVSSLVNSPMLLKHMLGSTHNGDRRG